MVVNRIERTGCKVNLYLDIVGRRSDGYHELSTLFLPLPSPGDTLHIRERESGSGFMFRCNAPSLDQETNLVVRAYRSFTARTGLAFDLEVRLEKCVPVGAGLGGGSADAGALLRCLNALAGTRALPADELNSLAVGLGADVPFFLQSEPCWAAGIGEVLTPVSEVRALLRGLYLVLVSPSLPVSTAWAYGAYAARAVKAATPFCLTRGANASIASWFQTPAMFNSFEQVVFPAFPRLRRVKEALLAKGAAAALLSGSGSSLFGLFRRREHAHDAVRQFERGGDQAWVSCLFV